jgi:hypothetical protein
LITQAIRRIRSAGRSPIHGGCMTCTAMSGNGCRIAGIATITAHLMTAAHGKVEVASFVAVAAATTPGAAGLLFASASTLASAAASSAFAFFESCNYFLLYHFTTYMLTMSALPEGGACEAAQPEVQRR